MSRPELDLSVYLVTDTALCGGPDGVVETVSQAVRGGTTLVQLRDHELDDDAFVALGRRLVETLAETGMPLLINDRVHLVERIGADGAHVGQADLPILQARQILGPDRLLGLSASTPAQVEAARVVGAGVVDYLGVGALHATGTKPEAGDLGLARVAAVAGASPWPVCAIGGVTAADASDLAQIGCVGLSVVSAICGQPDPAAAAAALATAWRTAMTAAGR